MAKKEVKTDLWVYELLQEADIHLTPQGCDIKEIDEALKTASKSNTGNAGYPEYCGVVKDFILVIEDKASLDKHLYKDEKDLISLMDPKYIEVTGIFTPRGGISIYPYANYGRPGTKYEKMAEFRMLHHDM